MTDSPSSSTRSSLPQVQVALNPLIKYTHENQITTTRPPLSVVPNQTVPIRWNVRELPTTESVRHLTSDLDVTIPLDESELNEPATYPPVEALHITCGLFEEKWPIMVVGAQNSPPSSPSGRSKPASRMGGLGLGMTVMDDRRAHHRLSSGSHGGYLSTPSSGATSWSARRTSFGSSNFSGIGRGVTLYDVLHAINICMSTPLQQDEWDQMCKKHQDRVNFHFDARWRSAQNPQETRSQGVLRGDCLLQSHIFAGLELLYAEGPSGSSDGHGRSGGAVTARCILSVRRPTKAANGPS